MSFRSRKERKKNNIFPILYHEILKFKPESSIFPRDLLPEEMLENKRFSKFPSLPFETPARVGDSFNIIYLELIFISSLESLCQRQREANRNNA